MKLQSQCLSRQVQDEFPSLHVSPCHPLDMPWVMDFLHHTLPREAFVRIKLSKGYCEEQMRSFILSFGKYLMSTT